MWRKKRTISTSKSTTTLLMKPSLSFTKNRTKPKSKSDTDLDGSKHRCPSITNLLSIGTGVVDDIDPASTLRTINIDKDEEDEENYNNKDRWSHNNGKNIGRVLEIIYDKSNNTVVTDNDDEDEEFEDSHTKIPMISSGETEQAKKETPTTPDIMMKLPESFTYFQTKKETEDKEKKVGTHSQHFPTNLHVLLDEAAEKGNHSHIVSWCSQGKAFQIHDLDAFVSLLANYNFRGQTNKSFDSFLCQLQAYDFHRCDKSGVVSHPLFIRGRRSLCYRMSSQQQQKPSLSSTTTNNNQDSGSGGSNDDDEDYDYDYAAIGSNTDEYEDEEVYVVGYNDEEGSPYDDYEGNNNNNNIGLDIDNDFDSIDSADDEEEQIDSIEGQSQGETLPIVSDNNNESKTLNVHNNNNSYQLRYRSERKVSSTSAPDLTTLISSPTTSGSSSSQTTKEDTTNGMITAHDKKGYLMAVSDGSGKYMKKNMSSTSLSSIMKKENSTNSLMSLRSASSSVRFGSVEIHEHSIELGCSVHSLRQGPSVTLGWERTSYEKMESIEDHKKQKEAPSPSPSKDNDNDNYKSTSSSPVLRPRSVEERIDKLLENGYTLREIRASLLEDNKERTKLKKLAAKRRFLKRTMSLPDFSTFFSTRK